jgi:nicotinamide riboside kinase
MLDRTEPLRQSERREEEGHTVVRIAIVGAHTTGKSTLYRHLAAYYNQNEAVSFASDPARALIDRLGQADFLNSAQIDLERQFAIVIEQILRHFSAPHSGLTIYDRHFVDQISYVEAANPNICNRPAWTLTRDSLLDLVRQVDLHIFARPFRAVPADELENDHLFLQNRIDVLISRYLGEAGIPVANASGQMQERFELSISSIDEILQRTHQ